MDAALRSLFRELRSRVEFDDTLIVVTSDHGEGFGEPSRVDPRVRMLSHTWEIHESLLHVP